MSYSGPRNGAAAYGAVSLATEPTDALVVKLFERIAALAEQGAPESLHQAANMLEVLAEGLDPQNPSSPGLHDRYSSVRLSLLRAALRPQFLPEARAGATALAAHWRGVRATLLQA